MRRDRKLASELAVGDRVIRGARVGTVVSIVPSVEVVRRDVLIITLQLANGRSTHSIFFPMSAVLLAPDEVKPATE